VSPNDLPPSLITLTTDFGTRDAYVGAMKAVILGIERHVCLVDITHDLDPHRILPAAFVLREVCPRFPNGTIHVAVIDPGVGGQRRPLLLWIGNQFYVGPDNGVFGLLMESFGLQGGWHLENPRLFPLENRSRTFHGRDVFAPAAALLARGEPPDSFGPSVNDPVRLALPRCSEGSDRMAGEILWIDRFGNGITNLAESAILDWSHSAPFQVRVSYCTLPFVSDSYASVPRGEPLAVVSSFGTLEIACNQERADRILGLAPGVPVVLEKTA
jgi:S-adenosyl-L-methionine hydrolase (adenosine-forming)